jgi:hypothetical protein
VDRLASYGAHGAVSAALSTRQFRAVGPGLLPSPTFAFGAPAPVAAAPAEPQPHELQAQLSAFAFPSRDEYARFGSIASIAESEASSFYSADGSFELQGEFDGYDPHLRKASW